MPSGMVLGLRIDGAAAKFDELLEEKQIPLHTGDVMVFYTDGITEAMNADSDLFGDSRLSQIVEEHGHLDSGELRERILREIEAFVGERRSARRHDDDPDQGHAARRGRGRGVTAGRRADPVIVNANIHTVDPDRPRRAGARHRRRTSSSRLVRTRMCAFVGRPATQVIDAGGRLVVPGFNDAHVHLHRRRGGARRRRPAVVARRSRHGRAGSRVTRPRLPAASGSPAATGITRRGRGRRCRRRDAIDAATPDHPCSSSGSTATWRSPTRVALARAGITDDAMRRRAARSFATRDGRLTGRSEGHRDGSRDARRSRRRRDRRHPDEARAALEARGVARRDDDSGHDGERGEFDAYQALRDTAS